MNKTSKFITIEGQDGAGKTTNLNFIQNYLQTKGIPTTITREPGGTALGEAIRDILLYRTDLTCSDEAELLLMFAARSQHLDEIILPNLSQGNWVISDRFTDASFAYQGAGRGVEFNKIETLSQLVHKNLQPDLTFVLDIPVDLAKSRGADSQDDRFEQQADPFKQRVRDYYLSLCKNQPDRVKYINSALEINLVQDSISANLDALIMQTG